MENQGQLYFGLYLTSDTLLMAIVLLSAFLVLAILISMMRIYKKAGKSSISAIVPIWSQVVLFQIVGKPWWYLFLLLIPIANIVILIQAYILLAKRFGKGVGFGIAMIFFPMIFIPLLSFYDYVGDESSKELKEETEPIYNPFNQTNVEQVMPEAPIASSIAIPSDSVVSMESVGSENLEDSNKLINESINSSENSGEIVNNDLMNETVQTEVDLSAIPMNNQEMVINDMPNPVETIQSESEVSSIIPEVAPISPVETEVIVEPKELNEVGQNPTIQDIQDALNINKQPVDVAFNSVPLVEEKKEEVETLGKVEILENQDEPIEMPEIAAKVCPACGVSLAEDVKFCTSCGTQL